MAGHHRESSGRPTAPAIGAEADRRTGQGGSTVLRVGVLIRGDSRQLCLIRDRWPRGLTVRLFSDVEPGEAVTVELSAKRRLSGRVAWIRGGNAAIRVDRSVDVAFMPAPRQPKPGWSPRLPKLEVDRLAMIRAGSDISFASTRDISHGGVRVICERPLEDGTPVVLTLEGFHPLEGVVRWNRGGFCGISFNRMIPPRDLRRWLAS